ncbi:MAG: plasmid pRiA4b ORF-3 family protein [Anaerolineae bacterium]|nr:plasmid pRiA4b ORF-3 family protein [Anaerolineae bacterium]
MLLGYVGERDLEVTPTGKLPLSALPEINARLTRPIEHGLRRPQLRSYPHVQGLYLLLRASGLTDVESAGRKQVLRVDERAQQSWQGLNPTEQYGTLLETWLLHGRPEIIGERGTSLFPGPGRFGEVALFVARLPADGLAVAAARRVEESIMRYSPGGYNVALLELFGLIDVQRGALRPGQGWTVERIMPTPFGTALIALLLGGFFGDHARVLRLESEGEIPYGALQPCLRPYFPEWRNNLRLPRWAFREGTYVFRVSLGRVWRRIAISGDHSLDALAYAILDAVDFDADHLFEFVYQGRTGATERVSHPATEEGPFTSEVRVGDLPLRVGQTMTFVYDFGDWWEFAVTLERVDPATKIPTPTLLESHGEPPEQYPSWDEWGEV